MTSLLRLIKLVEANRVREALTGLAFLEVPDKVKHLSNYGGELLKVMVKCNVDANIIMNICSQWKQKGINKFGLSQSTEAALNYLPYDQAKDYLNQLIKDQDMIRPHLYAPLIVKTSNCSEMFTILENDLKPLSLLHPESTFQLFADLIWSKIDTNYEEFFARCIVIGLTPNFLLNTCIAYSLSISDLSRVNQLLYSDYNFRIDYKLVPYLVLYILINGIDKSAHVVKSLGARSLNQFVFNSFLLINFTGVTTDSDDDRDKLAGLCKMMKKHSLLITPVAGELLLSTYDGSSLFPLIAKLIDHKTRFTNEQNALYFYSSASCSPIETYETHLKLLESTGNPKTRGIIRKLILNYCSGNNQPTIGPNLVLKERVNQLLEKLNDSGEDITPAMASVLMAFFAINNDLDKALHYKSLIPDSFTIDLSKLLQLAIKMAENGQLSESIDMVLGEIYKPSYGKNSNKSLISNATDTLVRDFLETIGKLTKDVKLIKDLSNSFLTVGNVNPNNKSLRPRVTIHLYCDDLTGALDEFTNCIRTYKKTPGQNNLIDVLIEKQLFPQVDKLINLVNQNFDRNNIIRNCANRFIISGYPEMGKKLISRLNYGGKDDKQAIRALIFHNLAKENIKACLSLVQFYRNKFDLEERKHFYNRIYSLSSISKDSITLDKISTLMKEEKIDLNINGDKI